jgi:hypothetical protein
MDVGDKKKALVVPVTLSPVELTDIFMSHYSCCSCLEMFGLIATLKWEVIIRPATSSHHLIC